MFHTPAHKVSNPTFAQLFEHPAISMVDVMQMFRQEHGIAEPSCALCFRLATAANDLARVIEDDPRQIALSWVRGESCLLDGTTLKRITQ